MITRSTSRRLTVRALIAASLFAAPTARADTTAERAATAQALYEAAAALIKQGKHADACPKLEESQRLDPAMGTQFFLAVCYESTGRPTSAWSSFLEVAASAKAAGNGVREATAKARAAALEPKLPRVTITLDPKASALSGIEITRDGSPQKPVTWGTAVPVDLGAHRVRATAPQKVPWETTVDVTELGQRISVHVPPLADMAPPPAADIQSAPSPSPPPSPPRAPESAPPPQKMRAQRVLSLVSAGVGVAAVAVGSGVGLAARSAWAKAEEACPKHVACSLSAHDDSARALSLAAGSTASFVIGGAALAGAVVLWVTAPDKPPVRVTPVAGPDGFRLSLEGAF